MSEVTKLKSEGRVAAGKRLAEWNRKNKEDLLKNKSQVKSSDKSSDESSEQEPTSQMSSQVWYGGSVAIILGIGIAAFFLYTRRAPVIKPAEKKEKDDDIFRMN